MPPKFKFKDPQTKSESSKSQKYQKPYKTTCISNLLYKNNQKVSKEKSGYIEKPNYQINYRK
jgi:hypothetical protein